MNLPQDSSSKPLAYQPVSYQEPQLPDLLAWAHLHHFPGERRATNLWACPNPHLWHSIQTGRDMASRGRLGVISRSRDGPDLSCLGHLELHPLLSSHLASFPFSSLKVVGCDHKLDSTKQEDKCLQCGGDGSTCYPVTGTFDADDLSRGGVTQRALKGLWPALARLSPSLTKA